MTIEKLITAEEVAQILNLSPKTIRAKYKKLGLPYYKVASLVKFRISEIELWLQDRHSKNIPMPKVIRRIRI